MATYISMLRGINVLRHNLIKMSELQVLCREVGFSRVRTYIQSLYIELCRTELILITELLLEGRSRKRTKVRANRYSDTSMMSCGLTKSRMVYSNGFLTSTWPSKYVA